MPGFHPGFAAFRPSRGPKRASGRAYSGRKPKPRLRFEPVLVVHEAALEHQELGPSRRVKQDRPVWCPALEANVLAAIAKEGDQFYARPAGCGRERRCRGIKPDLRAVLRIKLPELDKDDAPGRRPRRVVRRGRVANIRSGREIAMGVLEHPVKDQELLAAAVSMRREMAMRRVPDDRGSARHLIPDAIQHASVDAFDRRGDPGKPRGMHRGPFRKIRVDLHGSSPWPALPWQRPMSGGLKLVLGVARQLVELALKENSKHLLEHARKIAHVRIHTVSHGSAPITNPIPIVAGVDREIKFKSSLLHLFDGTYHVRQACHRVPTTGIRIKEDGKLRFIFLLKLNSMVIWVIVNAKEQPLWQLLEYTFDSNAAPMVREYLAGDFGAEL